MAKITQRAMLKRALEARGYHETKSASSKYVMMEKAGDARRFFLGAGGACRYGRIASDTFALLEQTRQKLLADGARLLAEDHIKKAG